MWTELAAEARTYLALALSALALACAAGIPLGLLAARANLVRGPVLALANIGRVVPSLAVLTFVLPWLGVGFLPALVALTLLAIPPIAINTDLGLRGVPPAAVDAARGMGMTSREMLWRVEWPLASAVVFTGVRTATTEVMASAVLAAFIGAGGLGEAITTGLQANQPERLWAGVVAIAALALLAELVLALAQRRIGVTE